MQKRLNTVSRHWKDRAIVHLRAVSILFVKSSNQHSQLKQIWHLLHCFFVKPYRDLVAYWIRVVMHTCKSIGDRLMIGLAILMGLARL